MYNGHIVVLIYNHSGSRDSIIYLHVVSLKLLHASNLLTEKIILITTPWRSKHVWVHKWLEPCTWWYYICMF